MSLPPSLRDFLKSKAPTASLLISARGTLGPTRFTNPTQRYMSVSHTRSYAQQSLSLSRKHSLTLTLTLTLTLALTLALTLTRISLSLSPKHLLTLTDALTTTNYSESERENGYEPAKGCTTSEVPMTSNKSQWGKSARISWKKRPGNPSPKNTISNQ